MKFATDLDHAHPLAAELRKRNEITEADVLRLRREVFGDGIVARHEAELLLELNRAVERQCRHWDHYLVEALTDHIVEQAEPRGYVSPDHGNWLIDRLSGDNRVCRANEIELLVRVLNRAQSAPDRLAAFALSQAARFAMHAEQGQPAAISEAEAELIRLILYAYGGEQGASISRAEAEALFELNERTDPGANHPAWRELFVKAIANYLMAAATFRAPSRMAALAREEWLDDTDVDVKSMLVGAVTGLGQLFAGALLEDLEDAHTQIERAWARRNARLEAEIAEAEIVTSDEARWLIDRLTRDGRVDDAEKALLAFLKRESPDIDPVLKPWFAKIGAAS